MVCCVGVVWCCVMVLKVVWCDGFLGDVVVWWFSMKWDDRRCCDKVYAVMFVW